MTTRKSVSVPLYKAVESLEATAINSQTRAMQELGEKLLSHLAKQNALLAYMAGQMVILNRTYLLEAGKWEEAERIAATLAEVVGQ